MNIFVGNLLFETTEEDVRKAFEAFGDVSSVAIVMEKKGAKSRGFGFVEMPVDHEAQKAIALLDGKDFMGRILNVSPARPKSEAEKERIKRKTKTLEQKVEKPRKGIRPEPLTKKASEYGGYQEGRRTRSFIKRQVEAGVKEPVLAKRKNKDNPMRWRRKSQKRAHLKKG